MVYAPRTQREILAALGDMPDPNASLNAIERAKRFLKERNIQVILVCLFVFPILFMLFDRSRKRGGAFYSTVVTHYTESSMHYWQNCPETIAVISRWTWKPEGDSSEIDRLDLNFKFILVTAKVELQVVESLNRHLKNRGNLARATWFFAANKAFSELSLSSPRITASASFQTFLFGHQLEIMTASVSSSSSLQRRLGETASESYTRIVVVTDVYDDVADLRLVHGYGPLVVLTRGNDESLLVTTNGGKTKQKFQTSQCVLETPKGDGAWDWACSTQRESDGS